MLQPVSTLLDPTDRRQANYQELVAIYAARRTRTLKPSGQLLDELNKWSFERRANFIQKVVHEDWAVDIYEMIDLTWDWQSVPSWLLTEMMRHRQIWRDFSLEALSQRAVAGIRLPFDTGRPALDEMAHQYMDALELEIKADRLHPEDLREYIPQGVRVNCVIKANVRAWHHFFYMRCSEGSGGKGGAHPIFEALADQMFRQAREIFPRLFGEIIPA